MTQKQFTEMIEFIKVRNFPLEYGFNVKVERQTPTEAYSDGYVNHIVLTPNRGCIFMLQHLMSDLKSSDIYFCSYIDFKDDPGIYIH